MSIGRAEALTSLRPNAEWAINGDTLTWLDTQQTEPTESEIQTEITRLQAEYDSLEYARLRKAEYDQLNQFEMQFDDQRDGTTTWVDAINEIKARYPK
jgi:predicted molibdopterin-dependent oxidoreductase YjgC